MRERWRVFVRACFKSKTFMLGHATLALGLLQLIQTHRMDFEQFIGPKASAAIFIGISVAIYGIRAITTKPLKDK